MDNNPRPPATATKGGNVRMANEREFMDSVLPCVAVELVDALQTRHLDLTLADLQQRPLGNAGIAFNGLDVAVAKELDHAIQAALVLRKKVFFHRGIECKPYPAHLSSPMWLVAI